MLPRDRFGALSVDLAREGPGDYQLPQITAELVTAPVAAVRPDFFLNAEGLGPEAALRVELLDEQERPLAGYAGSEAAVVRTSGFQTPVRWPGAAGLPGRVRVRIVFEGARRGDIRLSAIYHRP